MSKAHKVYFLIMLGNDSSFGSQYHWAESFKARITGQYKFG